MDTSTLVGAALRVDSVPYQAFKLAISQGELCVSAATIGELEKVLRRPKFDRYLPSGVRKEFVELVRSVAHLVPVSAHDEAEAVPACRDSKDNLFLALVVACDADVLVSSDADLLVLHPWRGVPIFSPADFLLSSQ